MRKNLNKLKPFFKDGGDLIERKIGVFVVAMVVIASSFPLALAMGAPDISMSTRLICGENMQKNGNVYETWEGEHIEIEVCARWVEDPGRPICLWVDHNTLPEGAEVTPDPATGVGQVCCLLSWTPAVGQAGTYNITFYAGEECGVPISSFNITIIVYPAITPGIRFSQIDFSIGEGETIDSSWGQIEVDIDEFTEYMGLDEGYLNGYSDAGWVIQNLLIQPLEGMESVVTYFNLGVPDGTNVDTISLYIEFSEEPVIEFHDGPRIEYPVDTQLYNAMGVGPTPTEPFIMYPPTTISFVAGGETWHFKKEQGPNENVQCARNQCFPMSIANSLQYLKNRYGLPVPHQHKPGLKGDNTLVGQLDSACNRQVVNRCNGKGVWFDDMLEGKFKYLKNNGLANKLTHKHQGYGYGWVDANNDGVYQKGELRYNQGAGSLPAGDFSKHGITSRDESVGGKVTFDWLCEQIKKCEDVEIVFAYEDRNGDIVGGHAVRVFGCGKILGNPFILYKHDAIQTYCDAAGVQRGDNEGLEEVFVYVKDLDADGMMNLGSKSIEICFALSESPKLPTWRYHFSFPNCPGGWLRVYATHNCMRIKLLFDGYIRSCETYEGFVPEKVNDLTVNDIMFDFYWDAPCKNVEHTKLVYPTYNENTGEWELVPIRYVFNHYIPDGLVIPFIGDPTGEIQEIYVVINLRDFLENPQPPQESYVITNGRCDSLPGYMISTTPIEFDPNAPPDEDPFSWEENLNCILWYDSELTTEPEGPCCPTVEIVKGFQFGKVTVKVTNEECSELTDLDWSITLDGFILMGSETTGTIESLTTGEETTIQSNFVFGFGPVEITAVVDECEPVTAQAFVLGPFISVQ